jgi:hypothetical protein
VNSRFLFCVAHALDKLLATLSLRVRVSDVLRLPTTMAFNKTGRTTALLLLVSRHLRVIGPFCIALTM